MKKHISAVGEAFVSGLERVLGNKLHGVYIHGAAAFPEDLPTGDIDFHVILTEPLTENERSRLYELHDTLARDFPPLGGELDGYYILLADARQQTPPKSQLWEQAVDESWALHCQHVRAGRCIVLLGPGPADVYPPVSWPEIEWALRKELAYVENHLYEYPDYCILNLCRLMYSFETKDVVISKAGASDWALNALPEWKRHIELARKSYAREATTSDRELMLREVGRLFEFARARIERACM
jgi:hypothetical protein